MRDVWIRPKPISITLSLLFCLPAVLVLPSVGAAWNYQVRYTVPDDNEIDEYRIYLELGSSGYQFHTQTQGPLAPYELHTYDLVGLPDDQDLSIVMTSCRYYDGILIESVHSNELFFAAAPTCVDSDCDDGNPCTLDYCFNDSCTYDAPAMNGQFCDDGNPGNDPDTCGYGICTGTPVPTFGVTALSGISNGATVSGGLHIEALVSGGTESVRFYLDGGEYRVESSPPYAFNGDAGPGAVYPWNTEDLANGLHTITAIGYDQDGAAGQAGTSVTVSFDVQNTPPECTTDADCGDGDACNGNEWCNVAVGACLPGTGLSCADPGQCQVASCDAAFGCLAQNVTNGTSCDDGDPATQSDACTDGTCAGTPTECTPKKLCRDGDLCKNDNSCKNGREPTRGNQKGGRGKEK
jgi:hypothetical protein